MGSLALGSLYLAFKYYKDIANVLLSCYFSLVGVYTLTSTLSPVMSKVVTGTKKYGTCPNSPSRPAHLYAHRRLIKSI